jgi:NAD(P)H-hydrate epimerase
MESSFLEWRKIVTSKEMARVEELAIAEGDSRGDGDGGAYMLSAGEAIARHIEQFCEKKGLSKTLTVIVGKGNKGGDGYTAAYLLKAKGFEVIVYQLYPMEQCSILCIERASRFLQMNGKVVLAQKGEQLKNPAEGVVLDAIFGTGFIGKIHGVIGEIVQIINGWEIPIISIDIPSGVSGNQGIVEGNAILANQTIALGAYKVGHFLGDGFLHSGEIHLASFGMSGKFNDELNPFAYVISRNILKAYWPKRLRTEHKYKVGQVIAFVGSKRMTGAALLSASAALRSGAGIVKLFHPPGIDEEFITAPYELIKSSWVNYDEVLIELKRSKSAIIGPGLGRSHETLLFLQTLIPKIDIPIVLDADALFFYNRLPKVSAPLILTPHEGELLQLLNLEKRPQDPIELIMKTQKFVHEEQVTLIYKGAPTFIFHPNKHPLIAPYGCAGMATAGSGDVLTGMVGAILARGVEVRKAAAMGVVLHQLAGEIAANRLSEDYMCASDLITSLPDLFLELGNQI